MTVLAAPTTIISTVTYPTGPSRMSAPSPALASRPTLPAARRAPRRRRDVRSANHADPVELRGAAASGSRYQKRAVDAWPLRGSDPAGIDGYRLVSRLGSGGMADVYLAVAPTGGPVAVKVLRADTEAPGPPGGPGATGTCQREYLLASTMDSDCTAPALGYGTSTAGAYLVTAYLPGYRCATTLLGRPIRTQQLWRFGSALARTLAAVHARGVVHCDVKPANLLVHGHDVRIIDFGIARYVGERNVGGVVQCSRGWAAPEQLWSTSATPAVDIFAWGCLIAHLSTGIHPFASQNEQEWILRLHSVQPDLSGLPPGLDEVIRVALARDPQDRPTANELATICRARGDGHPGLVSRPRRVATASP